MFICLAMQILSCGTWTLSCGMWDLVPWPGIDPGTPALGVWNISHWTIREVLLVAFRHEIMLSAWGRQLAGPVKLRLLFSCSVLSHTSWPHGTAACQAPLSMGFPTKDTGVGCVFLLPGSSWPRGLNPSLLHWQVGSFTLSHLGSPYCCS